MMWYIYALLGILIRRQAFEVNNGNDDWMDLVHPEKYGLTQTQNFYMQVSHMISAKAINLYSHNPWIKTTYLTIKCFYYLTAWKLSGRQNRSMVYTSKVLNGRRWCWQWKLSQRRMSKYKSTKKYSKTWAKGHCIYSFSWECQGNNFEPMQYGLNIVYI